MSAQTYLNALTLEQYRKALEAIAQSRDGRIYINELAFLSTDIYAKLVLDGKLDDILKSACSTKKDAP